MKYENFPTYERLDAIRQELRALAASDPALNEDASVGPGTSLTFAELRCLLDVCETFYKSQLPEFPGSKEASDFAARLGLGGYVDFGRGDKS